MKVAMWALGLLVLSLFGMVLVNLFGNITVTNQLNYTSMKNAVEAAMYDSLDIAHYRTGFCLCTNNSKTNGKWVFNSSDQYKLADIQYDGNGNAVCEIKGLNNCETLYGEYRIKPTTFSESLVRRFAEMVTNNKDYTITIQDIIEYPPKVSVKIVSKDEEFSPTEQNSGGYVISNQIDAIIEVDKEDPPTPSPTPVETPAPIRTPVATPETTPSNGSNQSSTPTPKATAIPNNNNTTNCKWHARMYTASWSRVNDMGILPVSCPRNSGSIYDSAAEAVNSNRSAYASYAQTKCKPRDPDDFTFVDTNIDGYQYFNVYEYGTLNLFCSNIAAKTPSGAINNCLSCQNKKCVARCHN